MEKKTKKYVILATIIMTSFLLGSMVTAVGPEDSSLLGEVWEYIWGIEDEVDILSIEVTELEEDLDLLDRISKLETRITVLETCGCEESNGFPEPDFDSNWISIMKGQSLRLGHSLNTEEYFVYLIGRYEEGEPIDPMIDPDNFHTWGYGLDHTTAPTLGICYEAYYDEIIVHRGAHDPYSDSIRVMCWKIPPLTS